MTNDAENYYEVLGIRRGASDEKVKQAYRELAKTLHPDRNPGDTEAERRFKLVSIAYEALKDEDRRRAYNEFISFNEGQQRSLKRQWSRLAAIAALLLIGPSVVLYSVYAFTGINVLEGLNTADIRKQIRLSVDKQDDRLTPIDTEPKEVKPPLDLAIDKPEAPVEISQDEVKTPQEEPGADVTEAPEVTTPVDVTRSISVDEPAPAVSPQETAPASAPDIADNQADAKPAETQIAAGQTDEKAEVVPPADPEELPQQAANEQPETEVAEDKNELGQETALLDKSPSTIAPQNEVSPAPEKTPDVIEPKKADAPEEPVAPAERDVEVAATIVPPVVPDTGSYKPDLPSDEDGQPTPGEGDTANVKGEPEAVSDVRPTVTPPEPVQRPEDVRSSAQRLAALKEPGKIERPGRNAPGDYNPAGLPSRQDRGFDGETFSDCKSCPLMSTRDNAQANPNLAVSLSEITVGEWNICVDEGLCQPYRGEQAGNPAAPVRGVNPDEMSAYADWLTDVTGINYRVISGPASGSGKNSARSRPLPPDCNTGAIGDFKDEWQWLDDAPRRRRCAELQSNRRVKRDRSGKPAGFRVGRRVGSRG